MSDMNEPRPLHVAEEDARRIAAALRETQTVREVKGFLRNTDPRVILAAAAFVGFIVGRRQQRPPVR